jgi:hypothetical protein
MHEAWEDNISEEEQWAKISINRKRWSYVEKVSKKNHRTTTAQVTAQLNILQTSSIHSRADIAMP